MANQYDRKNQAVWEFIDNGAFKRALEQCNRRIKKGEKFDYLLLLKAHCLTLLPRSTANHEEALSICRNIAVAGIKAPIGNLDVLMFLQRVWGYLNELGVSELGEFHREMSKCWDIAVKAKPGDERMAKEWVFGCVRGGDWEGAQKAAMQLQKNYGKRREYYFWAVVSSLLLHVGFCSPPPRQRMNPRGDMRWGFMNIDARRIHSQTQKSRKRSCLECWRTS